MTGAFRPLTFAFDFLPSLLDPLLLDFCHVRIKTAYVVVFLVREDSGGKSLVGFCRHDVFRDPGEVGRNAVGRLRIDGYYLFGG